MTCTPCEESFGLGSLGRYSSEGSRGCDFHMGYFGLSLCCVLLSFILVLVLCRSLCVHVRIRDVVTKDGKLVVTTFGSHYIHVRTGHSIEVSLSGTGQASLDRPGRRFRARHLDSERVELEQLEYEEVLRDGALDTSKGVMMLRMTSGLFNKGPTFPAIAWIALLIGMQSGLVYTWELRTDTILFAATVGTILAVVVVWLRRWRYWHGCAPLQCKIATFRDQLRLKNPQPRVSERGPGRAVEAGQLSDFYRFFSDYIRNRNMYYVNNNITLPLTAPSALSFAELAGPKDAQYFVSHYWGSPFSHFVEAISRHAKTVSLGGWSDLAYWICSLSNNQWRVKEEVSSGDWHESSFFKALRSGRCRETCMVLDEQALPLTRSWCLFEVLQTFILQGQDTRFGGLVLCTPSGVLNSGSVGYDVAFSLARRLSTLSVKQATASHVEDKRMIDDLVQCYGGYQHMDEYVRSNIRAILSVVRSHFEEDYANLDSTLGKGSPSGNCDDTIMVAHESMARPQAQSQLEGRVPTDGDGDGESSERGMSSPRSRMEFML